MVSLLHLADITEEGVTFQSPTDGKRMLLTPEHSIQVAGLAPAGLLGWLPARKGLRLQARAPGLLPGKHNVHWHSGRRWRCSAAGKASVPHSRYLFSPFAGPEPAGC